MLTVSASEIVLRDDIPERFFFFYGGGGRNLQMTKIRKNTQHANSNVSCGTQIDTFTSHANSYCVRHPA